MNSVETLQSNYDRHVPLTGRLTYSAMEAGSMGCTFLVLVWESWMRYLRDETVEPGTFVQEIGKGLV